MPSAWRIVKRNHAEHAFSGEGARLYGGRWNSPGVAVVYAAQSQSLAALEILVHLGSAELLLSGYIAFEVRFPRALLARVGRRHLPPDWREYPVSRNVQAVGDAWVAAGRSAVLQLPSATVPEEHVFLLNPFHPDFAKIRIGKPIDFRFDPRLFT